MPIFETKQIKQCIVTLHYKVAFQSFQVHIFFSMIQIPNRSRIQYIRFGCPLNTSMVYLLPKVFWKNKHLILHEVPTYYLAVVTLNIELIISQVWLPNHEMDRLWKGTTTIFTTTSAWLAIYGFEGKKKKTFTSSNAKGSCCSEFYIVNIYVTGLPAIVPTFKISTFGRWRI